MKPSLFASRLIAAREMACLTMQELADKSNLSKQAISKFENGQLNPSEEAIFKLAKALNLNPDFFYKEDYIDLELKLASVSLREKKKVVSEEFEIIKRDTIEYVFRLIELERIANCKNDFKNPIEDFIIKTLSDIKLAIKILRKKWNLGNVQISNVVGLLESKGILVYQVNRSENFEGLSAWAGKMPIIVINSAIKKVTRIRFTALHELGHILLNFFEEVDEEQKEKLCDAFSGEILFPNEVIVVEIGAKRTNISIEELRYLKEKYGISILAIIYATYRANVIDLETYHKWKKNYEDWYKKNEDFGKYISNEEPQRFNNLLMNCLVEEKISYGKAASLAKIPESILKRKFHLLGEEI